MEEAATTIDALPDEIILMILKRTSYADCNSFRRTCKRYDDLVNNYQSLWRVIYLKTVGKVIYDKTASDSTGYWLNDLKQYVCLGRKLINIIVLMSPNHFRDCDKEISLESAREIFDIALSSSKSYYLTLKFLQNFVQEASKRVNTGNTKKPYTLTEIHYGKIVVRYLIHLLYAFKWVHHNLYVDHQLNPGKVLNFFLQWIDPVQMSIDADDEVSDLIKNMVKDVDQLLSESTVRYPLTGMGTLTTCASGIYPEKQVMLAISQYMYTRRRMVLMPACNLDTLDIRKTIKSNSGHCSTLGAIFQAIATGFGITNCTLIAFPNHLYLQWRPNDCLGADAMEFNLENGELRPLGLCPSSRNGNLNRFRCAYSAQAFIHYIISTFVGYYVGEIKSGLTDNASQLLALLSNHGGQYRNFIPYLNACATSERAKMTWPFNNEDIHEDHRNYIHYLLDINKAPAQLYRDVSIREHKSQVQYCIGMICLHKVLNYVCIIRDWDLNCLSEYRDQTDASSLEFGFSQPFYHVTAVDQSDRYVPQERLILVPNPSRIYHLEDAIGKEFTHFNGFYYEPNDEKQKQYPGSMAIGNMYAEKYFAHVIPDKVQRY